MLEIVDVLFLLFTLVSLYIFTLYLLISLRNKKDRFNSTINLPSISIIIPAYNEEKRIASTIKAVKNLVYPKNLLEVIVVDDGSTDNTSNIVKRFKRIKLVSKKNGGKASALNFGTSIAKGQIVACVDSDSYPTPNALMKSVPFFEEPSVAAVTSSIFVKKPRNLIEHLQWFEYIILTWVRRVFSLVDGLSSLPGPLSLYRRNVLLKIGGFDEKNMTEDIEIAWRILAHGYKTKVALGAITYTKPPDTLRKWWHQRIRWNIGGLQTTIKYANTFLKKEYNGVGMFLVPMFYLSYIMSVLMLTLFFFLLGKNIYNLSSYYLGAFLIGVNPFKHFSISFLPDVLTIFGSVLLLLSLVWFKVNLNGTRKTFEIKTKSIINFIIFLTLYVIIFPINFVHSFYRFLTKNYEW